MFEKLEARARRAAERKAEALREELVGRLAEEGVRVEIDRDRLRLTARDLRWRMTGLKR